MYNELNSVVRLLLVYSNVQRSLRVVFVSSKPNTSIPCQAHFTPSIILLTPPTPPTTLVLSRPAVGLRVSRLTLWKRRMTGREPKLISGTFFYREICSPITVFHIHLPFPLLSYNTLYLSTLEVPDSLPVITQTTVGKSHSKICVHLQLSTPVRKTFGLVITYFKTVKCWGKGVLWWRKADECDASLSSRGHGFQTGE